MGKSTLIYRVVKRLEEAGIGDAGGFYTLEVSRGGKRIGFDIHTLDGHSGRLARVGFESRHRLGRYGIDMEGFERVALPALERALEDRSVVVIDEIGYMELKSRRFRDLVIRALDSSKPVLATVMRKPFDFAEKIKNRNDVILITVRVDNRDALVKEILEMLKAVLEKGRLLSRRQKA